MANLGYCGLLGMGLMRTAVLQQLPAVWRRYESAKERVHIRLDADVVEHFRSGGRGWQTRLNETLRQAVFGQGGNALQVPER